MSIWQVTVTVPQRAVGVFEIVLGEDADAISTMDLPVNKEQVEQLWIVEVIMTTEPDHRRIESQARLASKISGIDMPEVDIDLLQDQDWVQMALGKLSPIYADRFYVHGPHDRGTTPYGAYGLEIEAGQAFGTGHHGTTKGCLLALSYVSRRLSEGRPRRVLDIGTGSGVLALAAAKAWHCFVMAVDIDKVAVSTTKSNFQKNKTKGVRVHFGAGARQRQVIACGPYNVIMANILARPLVMMAADISVVAAKGGYLILSGFINTQINQVTAAYKMRGFRLIRFWDMGKGEMGHNWMVYLMQKQ